ncbi:MAG: S-layer homology domain-containing protein, partial [Clostridia bacterium]|nr:S-layer homology domain-containing protein [Clostridia bacterium]
LGVDSTQFSDVSLNFADYNAEGEWSANYVKAAVALGLMKGSEVDGKLYLNGNNSISRQEFFAIFARAMQITDKDEAYKNTDLSKFVDKDKIAPWFVDNIKYLVHNKIVDGNPDGKGGYIINPEGQILRCEIIKMVTAALTK